MKEFAGSQWCSRFPTSTSVDDLSEPFRGNVGRFLVALKTAGAAIAIAATYRPPERAYLMHFCCMIGAGQDPASITPMAGVDIDWTCGGDKAAAVKAATAMRNVYDIAFPAALSSRHTQRLAIDMSISWKGPIKAKDGAGRMCLLDFPGFTGTAIANGRRELWALGATYGVIKLPSDAPHWSIDGH